MKKETAIEVTIVIIAAVFIFCFFFELPFTPVFYEIDQQIFVHDAWRMTYGDVLYRDIFQFTFPGTQTVYAALFSLFGARYWIVGIVPVIAGTVLIWTILKVSGKVLAAPFNYLPALIFLFFGFRWFGIDGTHRMISPIFILAAILSILCGRTRFTYILAGAACAGASFFTQQRGVVTVAAIALFIVVDTFRQGAKIRTAIRPVAELGTAFGIGVLILCVPFIYAAGVENFLFATFTYPINYYHFAESNSYATFAIDLAESLSGATPSAGFAVIPALFYSIGTLLVFIAFIVYFAVARKRFEWAIWRGPFLIAAVGLLLTAATAGPNQYRFYQTSAPMLILFVWLISRVKFIAERQRWLAPAASACLIILGAFQAIRMQTHWDFTYLETPTGTIAALPSEQFRRYVFLSENTQKGDAFFEVYEPFIYFALQLRNPTKYSQIWPTDYTRPEQVADALADLHRETPKFILWDNSYNLNGSERLPGDHTGPMAEWVEREYFPVGQVYQIDKHPVQIWQSKVAR